MGEVAAVHPSSAKAAWHPLGFSRTPTDLRDAWAAFALAAINFAVAYPFRARFLTAWDSSLFALAIKDYSLIEGHPHPPGYPIFVFLGKLAFVLTGDENAALVSVSLLFGSLAVGLFYRLLREWVSIPFAVSGTFLFALSPNLVYNELVALSYTSEAAVAIAAALLSWRQRSRPTTPNVVALGIVLGLGTGLRTSVAIFLAPLAAWALLAAPRNDLSLRRMWVATASAAGAAIAWFIPMVAAGGGFTTWSQTTSLQSRVVLLEHTAWNDGMPAIRDHVGRLQFFLNVDTPTRWLLVACIALAALAAARLPRSRAGPDAGRLGILFVAWVAPASLFYALVFSGWGDGPRGYILILLPVLYAIPPLLTQWVHDAAHMRQPRPAKQLGAWLVGLLLIPSLALAENTQALVEKQVVEHDAWSESWLGLAGEFPPNETAILATYSWAFAKWYFPEYTMWGYFRPPKQDLTGHWFMVLETRNRTDDVPFYRAHLDEQAIGSHPVPAGIKRILLFDFQIVGENQGTRLLQDDIPHHEAFLSSGWRVLYIDVDPARPDIESYLRLGAADRA